MLSDCGGGVRYAADLVVHMGYDAWHQNEKLVLPLQQLPAEEVCPCYPKTLPSWCCRCSSCRPRRFAPATLKPYQAGAAAAAAAGRGGLPLLP